MKDDYLVLGMTDVWVCCLKIATNFAKMNDNLCGS